KCRQEPPDKGLTGLRTLGHGQRSACMPGHPNPTPVVSRLRFLGPLPDLVAVGMHRPALEALVAGEASVPPPPVDRAYLLKILDEEIARPFGHPLRPVVELVLNAADAVQSSAARGMP